MKSLEDAMDSGHALWCSAIKGPENENWLEIEHCDCWQKEAKLLLEKIKND